MRRQRASELQPSIKDIPTLEAPFEGLVAEFAVAFVSVSPERVDDEIQKWLSRLVLHVGADHSAVAKFFNQSDLFLSHSWARPGMAGMQRKSYEGMFPWACARVRQGAPIIFEEIDDLPDEAAIDRANYARMGIRSHLSVPLLAGGAVIGAFSVSTVQAPRAWPSETITRMHLLGSVLANALARQESWVLQQRMQEQLNQLSRIGMAGELAASLAHELTQPLAAILANAQAGLRFLARDRNAIDQIADILHDIVQDDKRAGAVISGLRAMMRKRQSERESVDMSELAQQSLAMVNMNIQAQHVAVRTCLEPGCVIQADKVQMQQVLLNLIINALEAMQDVDETARQLSVEIRGGSAVHCAVHDSGRQLTQDRLAKIFEPFWTTKTQGMGMGLAVCRSIIDAHHGAIWAEIDPHGGAIFRFDLPKESSDVSRAISKRT